MPKTKSLLENLLEFVLLRFEQTIAENTALRKIVATRGISAKRLRKELDEFLANPSTWKRAHAESALLEKGILELMRYSEDRELIEQLSVKGTVN